MISSLGMGCSLVTRFVGHGHAGVWEGAGEAAQFPGCAGGIDEVGFHGLALGGIAHVGTGHHVGDRELTVGMRGSIGVQQRKHLRKTGHDQAVDGQKGGLAQLRRAAVVAHLQQCGSDGGVVRVDNDVKAFQKAGGGGSCSVAAAFLGPAGPDHGRQRSSAASASTIPTTIFVFFCLVMSGSIWVR